MTMLEYMKANETAVLRYYRSYIAKNQVSPSYRDTAMNCGRALTRGGVYRVVARLVRQGRMRKLPGRNIYVPV